MSSLISVDFGSMIKEGANAIGQFVTTDKEKLTLGLQDKTLDVSLVQGQQQANIVAAAHKSTFVAGARPFILWVCGLGLGYQFLCYPVMCWIFKLLQAFQKIPFFVMVGTEKIMITPPPSLDLGDLMTILTGTLGMAGYRTYEKQKGIARDSLMDRVAQTPGDAEKPWYKRIFSKGD